MLSKKVERSSLGRGLVGMAGLAAFVLMVAYVWKDNTARSMARTLNELQGEMEALTSSIEVLRADSQTLVRVERISSLAREIGLITPMGPPDALPVGVERSTAQRIIDDLGLGTLSTASTNGEGQ